MRRAHAAALALAGLAILACRSPREILVDRRVELGRTLDQLYADFGGTELTGGGSPRSPGEGGTNILDRLMGGVDRSYFEHQCFAVGRGERPLELSGKLEAFLREEKNARRCRTAAELQDEVAALEKKVGAE